MLNFFDVLCSYMVHLVFKADHPGLHHLKGEVGHSLGDRVLQLSQSVSHLSKDFV